VTEWRRYAVCRLLSIVINKIAERAALFRLYLWMIAGEGRV